MSGWLCWDDSGLLLSVDFSPEMGEAAVARFISTQLLLWVFFGLHDQKSSLHLEAIFLSSTLLAIRVASIPSRGRPL